MPEDTAMIDPTIAAMLLSKLGKKFVTRREVVALEMDSPFDLHLPQGVVSGNAGDFIVRDVKTDELEVYVNPVFTAVFKPARKSRTKKPVESRSSLPPEQPAAVISDN